MNPTTTPHPPMPPGPGPRYWTCEARPVPDNTLHYGNNPARPGGRKPTFPGSLLASEMRIHAAPRPG
jgi:hypothetical protein